MLFNQTKLKKLLTHSAIAVAMLTSSQAAFAHCDTMEGPVIKTAQAALDKGDVTPLLKWVEPAEEQNIVHAFETTLEVREESSQAKDLADMYFYETLVRIHRAGEGAPYTGLKPSVEIDPAVALADKALDSGSVDKLVKILTKAMENGIRERFAHASNNQKHADDSVDEGREFIESYVGFTHYVEGLHGLIKGGAANHSEH
ncbi:hypothetical protein DI392_13630 [Vibrio albus]|uniref:Uncharacterized protein n=1 Tax=Vibrio albus TaxID=2200953 RepID=A0A2U3B811_9VIBR|nr:DUF6448 family protein [Vibrio albus]PWI32854.1 hypothetical protein DI392_13630 [Vibrio albus]